MENKIHFDRSRQPETVIPERLEVPEACEYRTASGVRIYVLPAPEYGVVRLSFVFRAGSSWQKVPFCASATVNNLAEGSRDMTARQIAERLDYYGSWFDVSMDRDWSVVTFVCLSKFFDKTLEVARRIMLEPEFPQEELRVYCDKSRQTLAINRTKVDFNARAASQSPFTGRRTLTASLRRRSVTTTFAGRMCVPFMRNAIPRRGVSR